jgi:hypothetical protein
LACALADAKIAARPLGLRAPIAIGRYLDRAESIHFDALFDHGFSDDGEGSTTVRFSTPTIPWEMDGDHRAPVALLELFSEL